MTAELRTAEIIAVGSELLTPDRIDTNSLWLTARLNELGIDVRTKAVVGDHRDDSPTVFAQALARADVVVTTGGLGPTDDDLTREVVADVLGLALVEDAEILAALRERFAKRRIADAGDQSPAGAGAEAAPSCSPIRTGARRGCGSSTAGRSSCSCRVRLARCSRCSRRTCCRGSRRAPAAAGCAAA